MADIRRALRNTDPDIMDARGTGTELKIRDKIKDIKRDCGELAKEKGVQCLKEAQEMETAMDSIIRGNYDEE